MEIVLFVSIVVVLAVSIIWFFLRPRNTTNAAGRQNNSRAQTTPTDRLATPSDYALAHRDHMLLRKRQEAAEDIIATNRFVPRSQSHGQPEYDGYSRRDRNHVVVGTAHIKKEDHVVEPAAASTAKKESQAGK